MLNGTITNTFAGSRRGSKWVYATDENGKRIATNSLKVTVSEDQELPPIITSDRIAKAGEVLSNLKFVAGADYRKASEEIHFEENKQICATYKPLPKPISF
tara:strand:+ start:1446 stop:1748 length:303 start_codon:yes stop_codon:yes gene_type:complete